MVSKQLQTQMAEWRHQIHSHPEAAFEEKETASLVEKVLTDLGYEVHTGIGGTGVVGVLRCGTSGRAVGLRADMDCIKVAEKGEHPYSSQIPERMHGCGHDGHTATLLGAAALLAERKNFDGTVYLMFQPAEEPGTGAQAMLDDGLLKRFPMDEAYSLHNNSMFRQGQVLIRAGQFFSSEDDFSIRIHGKGGHASAPNVAKDPLVAAAEMILAMQTIISRNVDPQEAAVISFTEIHTDGAVNVIPSNVTISGDVRAYSPEVQRLVEKRMREVCQHICEMHDMTFEFEYIHAFVPLINDPACTDHVLEAARNIVPEEQITLNASKCSASEDFARILEKVPGCYFILGGGRKEDLSQEYPMHHACFDYNDDILPLGAELFAELIRIRLPKK